ncbi:hypothetical protein TNCV_500981 [Trichonephila clavipes]|nr:hypothetical protein TNCV_500981 [Trichonephila clavipes]
MMRKKNRANNPRKNIALNTEKNAVFTAERYSVFAEKAIQFIVNGRDILMGKKEENSFKLVECSTRPPNDPNMLDWRQIWGSGRPRKGSNSAETVLRHPCRVRPSIV